MESAGRTTPPSESVYSDWDPPSKYHFREFLEFQFKLASNLSIRVARKYIDPDYSPSSLERLESCEVQTPEEYREEVVRYAAKPGRSTSQAAMWFMHMGLGSYFGEVLVRNLGGKWRYPSRVLVAIALLTFRPGIAYRHWYVVVGKRKIPVFELARRRQVMGSTESLAAKYREIAFYKSLLDRK